MISIVKRIPTFLKMFSKTSAESTKAMSEVSQLSKSSIFEKYHMPEFRTSRLKRIKHSIDWIIKKFKTKETPDLKKKYEWREIICFGKEGRAYTKRKKVKIKRPSTLSEPRKYTLKKDKSRYLYHITTKGNYQKIKESGGLIPQIGDDTKGRPQVFLFNLENLLNSWSRRKKTRLGPTYMQRLLALAAKDEEELVMLRIDAKKLDNKQLRIRPLDMLFKKYSSNDKTSEFLLGEDNGLSYIYRQRKTPYEYLYSDNIPLSSISVVGNSHFEQSVPRLFNMYNDPKGVIQKFLQNSKEKGFLPLTSHLPNLEFK